MPATISEKGLSRTREGKETLKRTDLLYLIRGTVDDAEAYSLLNATAPSTFAGLLRDDIRVDPVGGGVWDGTARYVRPENAGTAPQTGESTFAFETGGGTEHVTQSRQTLGRYPSASAPDYKGAIGVTHEAVEGVDIIVPKYEFSETHYKPDEDIDNSYKQMLFQCTGRMNLDDFRGFAPGELLFLGASGSQRGAGKDWEITYRFAGSPNRANFPVGAITVAACRGWDYLWVRYEDQEDGDAHAVVKRPTAVYVERIYEEYLFSSLEIG